MAQNYIAEIAETLGVTEGYSDIEKISNALKNGSGGGSGGGSSDSIDRIIIKSRYDDETSKLYPIVEEMTFQTAYDLYTKYSNGAYNPIVQFINTDKTVSVLNVFIMSYTPEDPEYGVKASVFFSFRGIESIYPSLNGMNLIEVGWHIDSDNALHIKPIEEGSIEVPTA